jgi:hypothetical protein
MPISNVIMSPQVQAASNALLGKPPGRIAGQPAARTGTKPKETPRQPAPVMPTGVFPYGDLDAQRLSSMYNLRAEADLNRDKQAMSYEAQIGRENLSFSTQNKLAYQDETNRQNRLNAQSDVNQAKNRAWGDAEAFQNAFRLDTDRMTSTASADLTKAQTESVRRANNTFTTPAIHLANAGGGGSGGGGYGSYDGSGASQALESLGRQALESRQIDVQNRQVDVQDYDSKTRRLNALIQGSRSSVSSYWG